MKKILSIFALFCMTISASAEEGLFTVTTTESKRCTVVFADGEGASGATIQAREGKTVTISITPEAGYVLKSVSAEAVGNDWNIARAAAVDILSSIALTKVEENKYTFTMPRADVQVSASCIISINASGEKTKDDPADEKEDVVKGLKLMLSEYDDEEPVVIDGVTYHKVKVDSTYIPETTTQKSITIKVPGISQVGNHVFVISEITEDAFKSTTDIKVTKVILPETEEVIEIAEGAMSPDGEPIEIQTPLALLDDYALMSSLQENFEAVKIYALAKSPNRYWTFSSGVDVIIPEGILVYGVYMSDGTVNTLQAQPIDEANNSGIIKANNGVLVSCTNARGGDIYTMVANPGRQKSGTTPATTNAKDYKDNRMAPVIVSHHYNKGDILILKNNEFHTIKTSGDEIKVPACKAVLNLVNE
ncbi:MAG: hypothetical protein K6F89_09065 [Prevotella sp.]|nr:hypothetical protein [Prevotella sp.]